MSGQLIVQKFGGSSVANAERLERVAGIIHSRAQKGNKVVAVVSAMGDTTDELIELANKINPDPPEREMDMLMSTGEQISSALLAMAIDKKGSPAISFTGPQVGIITDEHHTTAKIRTIETKRLHKELNAGKIVVVTGFQGMTRNKDITTLGRGGSDLSAVALAVALKADVCEIYTDVEGIYTADPRIVPEARKLKTIDFDEMLELAARGAQVMQTRAVEVAKKYNMPLHVRSSFVPKEGTIIMKQTNYIEQAVVRGVALTENEAKITITDVPDRPGIAAQIFNELARRQINIDMIVQNVGFDKLTDISFTVAKSSLQKSLKTVREICHKMKAAEVSFDEDIAKVSVAGVGMRAQAGVAARCFSVLADAKINIDMISTSEISISCIVKREMGKKALNVLHKEFELDRIKE
jgi:aspartate kinase